MPTQHPDNQDRPRSAGLPSLAFLLPQRNQTQQIADRFAAAQSTRMQSPSAAIARLRAGELRARVPNVPTGANPVRRPAIDASAETARLGSTRLPSPNRSALPRVEDEGHSDVRGSAAERQRL